MGCPMAIIVLVCKGIPHRHKMLFGPDENDWQYRIMHISSHFIFRFIFFLFVPLLVSLSNISFHFVLFIFCCFYSLRDARNEQCYEILSLLTKFDGVLHSMLGVHCTFEARMEVAASHRRHRLLLRATHWHPKWENHRKKSNLITIECGISGASWNRQRNAHKKSSKCNFSETAHIKWFAFVPFAVGVDSNSDSQFYYRFFQYSVARRADVCVCGWRAALQM